MAVAENAGIKTASPSQNLDNTVAASGDLEETKPMNDSTAAKSVESNTQKQPSKMLVDQIQNRFTVNGFGNHHAVEGTTVDYAGYGVNHRANGFKNLENGHGSESFKTDMQNLVEVLSKLNPMAEEFVPPSLARSQGDKFTNNFVMHTNAANASGVSTRRKRHSNYNLGKRKMNTRTSMAQQQEVIRRTVYVSDIDHQVTEEQLAGLFLRCGQVVDCRICGDPNSVLRFAFIEFTDEESTMAALRLSGTMLGYYPVKVLPSKTAIAPVNPTFLPKSEDEREICSRTIYCTNLDKKITQADVKLFFESICGEVQRLRLLGDHNHFTRIAFVEFTLAESAIAALNCSGAILGALPIRISPSKTPVRPRLPPRPPLQNCIPSFHGPINY